MPDPHQGRRRGPPWWPEGEPFPPSDWREMRRHFFRRIAIVLAVFFGFVVVAGWLSFAFFHRGGPPHPGQRPFFPGFFLLFLLFVVGFAVFGRAVRRTAGPIGDVMDAAAKVAAGDYSARSPVYGPPEVRELAEAFNEMAARVEASERQRRNLMADVTHELRTPLSVIQGRVEGVLDGVYPPDEEHLGLVVEQTRVLARLLDDLQLLSNAEAGALTLVREPAEPRELIDAAVSAFEGEARERRISLRADVASGLPTVEVDRVRIGEVFANLLTNALRYAPSGGSVTISASRDDRTGVAFAVADTGPGIPPERLPQVFDRLSKSPESRGSGLGLAIARSLVQAHGGTISAQSGPIGTTVRFVLPPARR